MYFKIDEQVNYIYKHVHSTYNLNDDHELETIYFMFPQRYLRSIFANFRFGMLFDGISFVNMVLVEVPPTTTKYPKDFYCNYIFYSTKLDLNIIIVVFLSHLDILSSVSDFFPKAASVEYMLSKTYRIRFKHNSPVSKLS